MDITSYYEEPLFEVRGKPMAITEKIPIPHRLGLHLRAGAELVKVASRFQSDIRVSNGNRTVDAKSLLGLLTLGAIYATVLEFSADGDDASRAIQAIRELLETWKGRNETI